MMLRIVQSPCTTTGERIAAADILVKMGAL